MELATIFPLLIGLFVGAITLVYVLEKREKRKKVDTNSTSGFESGPWDSADGGSDGGGD